MNTELGFTVQQKIPTAIAKSFPVRVTVPNHGMTKGQFVRATNFVIIPVALATGMYQLNNNLYMIGNVTTDTFDLFDEENIAIDGRNFTTFINNGLAMFTLTGPDLNTENLNTQEGI